MEKILTLTLEMMTKNIKFSILTIKYEKKINNLNSSLFFFVTSHCKHILSRGSSYFLAVLCIIAVKNDCGLKNPESQTDVGT